MRVILLSGGSGKRLWPLSNEENPKQFLKMIPGPDDQKESMLQRMYRMIHEVDPDASIIVAAPITQVEQIHEQLGEDVPVSVEPCRRDTFPAIALAAAYLHDAEDVPLDEAVVVCPVDPMVDTPYFETMKFMEKYAAQKGSLGDTNLVLMGIEPGYPSEKYGYIIPQAARDEISKVKAFTEKPDIDTAERLFENGALWNGGVFAFKLGYVLEMANKIIGYSSYDMLYEYYADLEKISFDYAVVEKEKNIEVVRFSGVWEDIGTWNSLTDTLNISISGNATVELCRNTTVINELNIPMCVIGIDDAIVTATKYGILVVKKDASNNLKDYIR